MASIRQVGALLAQVEPLRESGRQGLRLGFRPAHGRLGTDRIEDVADLGPELTVASVAGLGKVLRLLRAARLARPRDPHTLLGDEEGAARLLERARGTRLRLGLRSRSRLRFVAWTESGVEAVNDVAEVIESPLAWLVRRRNGRFPVLVSRAAVVRHRTETERWYEVVEIERG